MRYMVRDKVVRVREKRVARERGGGGEERERERENGRINEKGEFMIPCLKFVALLTRRVLALRTRKST